jgi:hypothetical protein
MWFVGANTQCSFLLSMKGCIILSLFVNYFAFVLKGVTTWTFRNEVRHIQEIEHNLACMVKPKLQGFLTKWSKLLWSIFFLSKQVDSFLIYFKVYPKDKLKFKVEAALLVMETNWFREALITNIVFTLILLFTVSYRNLRKDIHFGN